MNKKHEARYYDKLEDQKVQCRLCPHNCNIKTGKTGICGVRQNTDGILYSNIYGEITAINLDPIEKKPLYHFYPGSGIFSIGTKGCNFKCIYCQNWNISQDVNARSINNDPETLIKTAAKEDTIGIAYTYSEPIIWYEYVLDCAKIARAKGLKNVLVSNGFISPEPLNELLEYTDAMNIDVKAFRDESYKKVSKGNLDPVLNTIKQAHKKCHIELTTLVVTGINDNLKEMQDIIDWIASVDKNIPWHVSRYHPSYKYDAPATDINFMMKVYDEAVKKLNFVYCGNIAGSYGHSDTVCPNCKTIVIKRSGYYTEVISLKGCICAKCGIDLGIVA